MKMENEMLIFEDYLKNGITEAEAIKLEQSLKDPKVLKRFNEYKKIRSVMLAEFNNQDEQLLKDKLSKLGIKYFGKNTSKRNDFLISWPMKIAASFLILLGIGFGVTMTQSAKYSDQILAERFFEERSTRSTNSENLNEIAKNYSLATDQFKNGDYAKAAEGFRLIAENTDSHFKDFAEWNLVMCFLKNDVPGDHEMMLNKILGNTEHLKYAEAVALEKELNAFFRKMLY